MNASPPEEERDSDVNGLTGLPLITNSQKTNFELRIELRVGEII